MGLVRRQTLSLTGAGLTLVLAAAWVLAPAPANAQTDFPSRRIHLVLPYPAGGVADVATRIVTDKLSEIWHQPIVVEAKPAAQGRIGHNKSFSPPTYACRRDN
jgi:tripartite-type tricarboxylate transporter receptor subunit TctC